MSIARATRDETGPDGRVRRPSLVSVVVPARNAEADPRRAARGAGGAGLCRSVGARGRRQRLDGWNSRLDATLGAHAPRASGRCTRAEARASLEIEVGAPPAEIS